MNADAAEGHVRLMANELVRLLGDEFRSDERLKTISVLVTDEWGNEVPVRRFNADDSARFRCVALDLPGHGGSDMPATVSIATMAEAVNTVKDQIGSRRAILIGHSMGCRVIMEAFQQILINIVGLVFVDGSFVGGAPSFSVTSCP